MVTLYKATAKASLVGKKTELTIDNTDYELNGISRFQQKIIFVSGALANEKVQVQITEHKADYF